MRLTLWIFSLFIVIILGGGFLFIKFTSPLDIGTIASTDDKQVALIGVGNNGFIPLKLTKVLINNQEVPDKVKLQVSNLLDGFVLTDDYSSDEAKDIQFNNIDDISLKAGTSPTKNFEKTDEGKASDSDVIYGINIIHSQAINKVHVTYKYFGISFKKAIIISKNKRSE